MVGESERETLRKILGEGNRQREDRGLGLGVMQALNVSQAAQCSIGDFREEF